MVPYLPLLISKKRFLLITRYSISIHLNLRWLEAVGYFNSYYNSGPNALMFEPSPTATSLPSSVIPATVMMFCVVSLVSFLLGIAFSKKYSFAGGSTYTPIGA